MFVEETDASGENNNNEAPNDAHDDPDCHRSDEQVRDCNEWGERVSNNTALRWPLLTIVHFAAAECLHQRKVPYEQMLND